VSFRGARSASPESILPAGVMDSGPAPSGASGNDAAQSQSESKTFFIIFVDAIFTTLFGRPFTNAFDVMAQSSTPACVYPARSTG
jgi:hypothetical protein